ncbi:MAG: phosphatidate cytidylyltransferase [Deltaproteobacteria bacterium]|nr:phosphatidate cytidylyltransferase [Deltaproteobacteria bacterium]
MSFINSNLAKRVAVAVVAAPVIIILALIDNHIPWKLLTAVLTILGLYEFASMAFSKDDPADKILLITSGTIMQILLLWDFRYTMLIFPWAAIMILTSIVLTTRTSQDAVQRLGKLFLGVFYIAMLFTFVAALKTFPQGGKWIIFTLTVVWFSDTGAYFMGKAFGKHKLSMISPNKTWEGSAGGILASIGAGALGMLYLDGFSIAVLIILSIFAGIMGQIGDLAESLIKRSCNVKDSGNLIPGHGGILDRFDALLFAAPIITGYLIMSSMN